MEENEWEAIQLPNSTTTHSDEDDVVVVAVPTNFNQPSVFPPTNHENLPVTPPLSPPDHQFYQPISATSSPPSSYTSSLTSSSSGVDETEVPYNADGEISRVNPKLGIFSSRVLSLAYGIRNRIGIWSIATVAAVVVVVAYGRRWRRQRRFQKENMDQMMLLINQKDEKIKQLLIKIDQMNKILSARTRVPVHRIVADRPFIDKPRLN